MGARLMRVAHCPVCGRWEPVKKDGMIGSHRGHKTNPCLGYGKPHVGKMRQYTYYPPVR